MTEQYTIPPAHVWEKIEKILDEQDIARANTNKLISDSFSKIRNTRRLNFFFATMISTGLIVYFILNHSLNVKKS